MLLSIVLLLSTSPAFAYSSGPNSCSAASHGGSAIKSGDGGHALAHDGGASPAPGARLTVTLSHPSTAFKGFILKSDEGSTLAVKDATKTQTVSSACSGALGHKSAADKTSVEAYLTLPTAAGKTVTVSAEAVRGKMEVYKVTATITTASSTDPSPPPSPPPPPSS